MKKLELDQYYYKKIIFYYAIKNTEKDKKFDILINFLSFNNSLLEAHTIKYNKGKILFNNKYNSNNIKICFLNNYNSNLKFIFNYEDFNFDESSVLNIYNFKKIIVSNLKSKHFELTKSRYIIENLNNKIKYQSSYIISTGNKIKTLVYVNIITILLIFLIEIYLLNNMFKINFTII